MDSRETEAGDAPLIRPLRWPQDSSPLARLDTSYLTDHILHVDISGDIITLTAEAVTPPLHKRLPLELVRDELDPEQGLALVAEQDGKLVAYAAARLVAWNGRAELLHLYVTPRSRRTGLGARLLAEAVAWARAQQARGLWLETQNINPDAVRFYRHHGFRFCGLDASLYDPIGPAGGEIALFYFLPMDTSPATPGMAT